ncbi:nuclear transport factor 2 family protein [Nocardioides sp. WY-20]|uniref:Nuclear transport factor 2 family protein n=2 Tax=Nocardioides jiangxiensis TaxID=3064524 RepID=A0ABT9AZC8_9ACTN|nr:nuclear transport factor 2 family protein [Nocardioides sp. WY-20]MDO7867802.1 nuclear transport factor 2 family protein [Nocardioides sp. WY-20]
MSDEEQVVALERSLLTDEVRRDPAAVAGLLAADWSGIPASGVLWSRDDAVEAIAPYDEPVSFDLTRVERLAAGALLVLGRVSGGGGSVLTSSLWLRAGHTWVQRFHQSTPES